MRTLLILICLLVSSSLSQAAPFLISDPVAAGSWDKIEIVMDGAAPILVAPVVVSPTDARIRLFFDLDSVSVGNHNVTLRGKKGVWYGATTPFAFTRPVVLPILNPGLSE